MRYKTSAGCFQLQYMTHRLLSVDVGFPTHTKDDTRCSGLNGPLYLLQVAYVEMVEAKKITQGRSGTVTQIYSLNCQIGMMVIEMRGSLY